MPDPFAQYVVSEPASDPFAAFAVDTPPEAPKTLKDWAAQQDAGLGQFQDKGFSAGFMGESPNITVNTLKEKGLSPLVSGQNLGALAKDALLMSLGTKTAGRLYKAAGTPIEALGEQLSSVSPIERAGMGASAGYGAAHMPGAVVGASGAVAGPPALRLTGRLLSTVGNAMTAPAVAAPEVVSPMPMRGRLALKSGVYEMGPATEAPVIDVTPARAPEAAPAPEPVAAPEPAMPKVDREAAAKAWDAGPGLKARQENAAWIRNLQEQMKAKQAEAAKLQAEKPAEPMQATPDVAQQLREALTKAAVDARNRVGSRQAAREMNNQVQGLNLTPEQMKALAPTQGPKTMPSAVRERIDSAMKGMSADEMQAYLDKATSDIARQYIQLKMGAR